MSDHNDAVFPACFRVTRDIPGAEVAILRWFVNTMHRTISGTGKVTQAINPPTDIQVEMTGHYIINEDGGLTVLGAGAIPGASIQVILELEGWGGPGKALSLQWLANNHYFSDTDVPAKSEKCFG